MQDRALTFLRAMYESMAGGTPEQKQQLATALSLWVVPLARNLTEAYEAGVASTQGQAAPDKPVATFDKPAPAAKPRRSQKS